MECCNSKILVLASNLSVKEKKLQPITAAAERMAELLKIPMEVATFDGKFNHIYVYYKTGNDEKIPVYSGNYGDFEMQDVYRALCNMIFVLSFHPKYSRLKRIRKEVTLFS